MLSTLMDLFSRSDISALVQRRRQRRFACCVPVFCTYESETASAMIVDMAQSGLRILIRQKVKPGAAIQLHYNKPEERLQIAPPIDARVVWTRRADELYEVGVQCDDQQLFWVPTLLRSLSVRPDYSDVRKTIRFSAPLEASVLCKGRSVAGELADLSLGGASFRGFVELTAGTALKLSIHPIHGRSLTIEGSVVRQSPQSDGRCLLGIRFDAVSNTHQKKLSRMLRHLRTSEGQPRRQR